MKNKALTEKELAGYRQWLAELDQEARAEGKSLSECDSEVWELFDPEGQSGRQIYESFTDEALLDQLISTMTNQKKFGEVYCVYRAYLTLRYGTMSTAKGKAQSRQMRLEHQAKWPPDWAERVSVEPLLDHLKKRGRTISAADLVWLQNICNEARRTGQPPYISQHLKKRFIKITGSMEFLELLGIPYLSKTSLEHLRRYWRAGRIANGGPFYEEITG